MEEIRWRKRLEKRENVLKVYDIQVTERGALSQIHTYAKGRHRQKEDTSHGQENIT